MGRPPRRRRTNDGHQGYDYTNHPTLVEGSVTTTLIPVGRASGDESPRTLAPSTPMTTGPTDLASPLLDAADMESFDFMNRIIWVLIDGSFTGPALSDIFTSSNGPGGSEVHPVVTSLDPTMATSVLAAENHPNDRPLVEHPENVQSGNPTRPYTNYLTELCELNVSLYNHPLYADASSDTPQNPTRKSSPSPASATTSLAPPFRLPDLKIGQLLSMTAHLKNLVGNITSIQGRLSTEGQDIGTGPMHSTFDRSTALIVLSCYARFNVIYTRTIDALREIRATGQTLGQVDYLMPTLSIDGFDLGLCHDVQLSFAIQLWERLLYRLRGCMRSCGEKPG
ncbi:hypothetical protein FQN53_001561 [Emmonsiellopsis sp. PD_33]|nr:hypothetical protein FQN53_001561 [Emmonsiellopsis sp. PD_33]